VQSPTPSGDSFVSSRPVERTDRFSRFIPSKTDAKDRLPGTLFMPTRDSPQEEFARSVFRTTNLPDSVIWENVSRPVRDKVYFLYGRADVLASAIDDLGLEVRMDEPPPHHANIRGWPEAEHLQQELADEIADRATLVRPEGTDRLPGGKR